MKKLIKQDILKNKEQFLYSGNDDMDEEFHAKHKNNNTPNSME